MKRLANAPMPNTMQILLLFCGCLCFLCAIGCGPLAETPTDSLESAKADDSSSLNEEEAVLLGNGFSEDGFSFFVDGQELFFQWYAGTPPLRWHVVWDRASMKKAISHILLNEEQTTFVSQFGAWELIFRTSQPGWATVKPFNWMVTVLGKRNSSYICGLENCPTCCVSQNMCLKENYMDENTCVDSGASCCSCDVEK